MIDMSGRSVRRLNSAGKLPRPVKIGGAVKWRGADAKYALFEIYTGEPAPDGMVVYTRRGLVWHKL